MMIYGAPIAMQTNIPSTLVRHSRTIFCQEPQIHWAVLVYHGVTYVRSMVIDIRTVITCRRWLPRQKICTVHFVGQSSRTWWQKLSSLWIAPGKDVWFILCERWGPPNNASTTTSSTTNSTSIATSSTINSISVIYTTTFVAVCPRATAVIVYITAAVCTSAANGGTTTV